jgi:hypothetical protein
MRKFISVALTFAAVAVVSCQKENSENVNISGEPFSFTAGHIDTKTVLIDNVKTYWTSTDQLAAFDGTGTPKMFSTDITENSASAKFTCEDFVLPANYETAPLLAFYPYNSELSTDFATKVDGIVFPGTQQVVDNGFDPDATVAWAMGAFANKNSLVFNNLYSLLKFTVSEDFTGNVTVKSNNASDKLTGTATLLLDGTLTMKSGQNSAILEGTFAKGNTYYIAVVPGTYESGVTVMVNGYEVKSKSTSVTLEVNKIHSLGEVGMTKSKWGIVGSMTNWADNMDIPMYKEGDYSVAKGVAIASTDEFKFRANGAWTEEIAGGLTAPDTKRDAGWVNMTVSQAGTYYIYIDKDNNYYIMTPGKSPLEAGEPTDIEITVTYSGTDRDYLHMWSDGGEVANNLKYTSTSPYTWKVIIPKGDQQKRDYKVILKKGSGWGTSQTADSDKMCLRNPMPLKVVSNKAVHN